MGRELPLSFPKDTCVGLIGYHCNCWMQWSFWWQWWCFVQCIIIIPYFCCRVVVLVGTTNFLGLVLNELFQEMESPMERSVRMVSWTFLKNTRHRKAKQGGQAKYILLAMRGTCIIAKRNTVENMRHIRRRNLIRKGIAGFGGKIWKSNDPLTCYWSLQSAWFGGKDSNHNTVKMTVDNEESNEIHRCYRDFLVACRTKVPKGYFQQKKTRC